MINIKNARKYCCEDLSLIENYAEAIADQTQIWDIHHRAEILPCGTYTRKNLKDHGLYYRQPAARLVFLTHAEHMQMHYKGRPLPEEIRRKISEVKKGWRHSEETKKKMSEAHRGKRLPEETRRKMSEACKKYWSDRRKLFEANRVI